MLQWDGEVMMVLVMVMMILMKPSSMTVTMAMISSLQKGISPSDFCLPESFFSLYFPPHSGGGIFLCSPQS
jgi:hypothetical protein